MGKNNDVDIELLNSIVTQFDNISRFNDGQLEINKLLLEMVNMLEKRIEELEKKAEQLDKGVKEAKKLAMVG